MLPLAHFLFASMLFAQDPSPSRPPPASGPDRREAPAVPTPDPAVDAWTAQLVARLGDANRAIARSAEAGLIAIGPMAVPALRKAADGNVPEVAERARRALEEIRFGPPPFRRRPGGPDGPPPGAREGDDGRPWPPPFPRDARDRREGPPRGDDAREGRGPMPRDGGARGEGPRDGEMRDGPPPARGRGAPDLRDDREGFDGHGRDARRGPRSERMPPDGPRERSAGRGEERRGMPPPRVRPRDDGARREGPLPPDRDAPPRDPRDERRDDLRDAR